MAFRRHQVYPITQTILGIILIIIGVFVILIVPNIIPQDIFHALQKLIVPELFYSPYSLIGGSLIIAGVINVIVGLVYKYKGYYEGEYV